MEIVDPATLLKVTHRLRCFSHFLNCANGIKSRKGSQLFHTKKLQFYKCFFMFLRGIKGKFCNRLVSFINHSQLNHYMADKINL